ncbi:MAG: HNH endonuclease signature motif containing protein [Lentisphaeria bacterium]|nr:HNH endonuclease signature motif containing protein [Lentisphaeria bacterium]
MGVPSRKCLGEELAWQYANLARATAALTDGVKEFSAVHHQIRMKLYKGLSSGTMQLGSFFADEKYKIGMNACCYCGSVDDLSVDHLIPRKKLGTDLSENLIAACRSCNSSKRERDMLSWLRARDIFPSLVLLRRYLKLVYLFCQSHELLMAPWEEALMLELPFDLANLKDNLQPLYHLECLNLEYPVQLVRGITQSDSSQGYI